MAKSSNSKPTRKPPLSRRSPPATAKPYPGFPLTPHSSGYWCKKKRFNGKPRYLYFGTLADPYGALEQFNREWPYLKDGRTPPQLTLATTAPFAGSATRS